MYSKSEARERLAHQYLNTKHLHENISKKLDEIKKTLTEDLIAEGVPDDKGNLWCPAGDMQLKRERRISEVFDVQAAEKWAKETGNWDAVKTVVEVLDEDKLLALGWNNEDIRSCLPSFYKQKETWAFKVIEQKSYEDD